MKWAGDVMSGFAQNPGLVRERVIRVECSTALIPFLTRSTLRESCTGATRTFWHAWLTTLTTDITVYNTACVFPAKRMRSLVKTTMSVALMFGPKVNGARVPPPTS